MHEIRGLCHSWTVRLDLTDSGGVQAARHACNMHMVGACTYNDVCSLPNMLRLASQHALHTQPFCVLQVTSAELDHQLALAAYAQAVADRAVLSVAGALRAGGLRLVRATRADWLQRTKQLCGPDGLPTGIFSPAKLYGKVCKHCACSAPLQTCSTSRLAEC